MKISKLKQLDNKCRSRNSSSNLARALPVITFSLIGIALPFRLALSSPTYAYGPTTSQSNVSVNVPVSCTLSGQVISAHTATMANGTNRENIGTTKMKIYCNDSGGYTVYAIGASNDEDGNTDMLSSIGSHNIATGLGTSGSSSAWAMKLTAGTGTGSNPTLTTIASDASGSYTNYHVIPNTYTAVASRPSATDMNPDVDVTGSYFTTTYRVFVSGTQPAATYTGKVKYAILHPQLNDDPLVSIEKALADAHAPTKTLPDNKTYYTIQGLTASICDNVNITGSGATAKLVDTRDDNLYYVAKLPDGKCWLLDNLRLDPTDSTTAANMNSTNTNASDAAIDNYLHPTGTAPQTGWSTVAVADVDTGFTSYVAPTINNSFVNTPVTSYGVGSGLTGIYYNFCAATAGTYCYAQSQGVGDASQDVCPANWRMPTGGPNGEYQNLCNVLYNDTCPTTTPMTGTDASSLQYNLSVALAGHYYDNSIGSQGVYGIAWSSTRYLVNNMYHFCVGSTAVYPQGNWRSRNYGLTMRCVAGS